MTLRKGFDFNLNNQLKYSSFEHLDLTLRLRGKTVRLVSIYRPPHSSENKLTPGLFFKECSELLELLLICPNKLVLAGDFNFHLDVPSVPNTRGFMAILAIFGLELHNEGATHISTHTLNLFITRRSETEIVDSLITIRDVPSDHFCVVCTIKFPRPESVKF